MSIPSRSPAECVATILLWLSLAVDGHSTWGRLARPLGLLILDRIRSINQRFARLAARVDAGKYVPRRSPAPRRHVDRKPRRPNPLPQGFAWLVKLVPELAVYGSQLQFLFADAEMAALMATAPEPMRRPLRSLCRMLGVTPPLILERERIGPARENPSPAKREREGPVALRREGEGVAAVPPAPSPPHPPLPSRTFDACGPPFPLPA